VLELLNKNVAVRVVRLLGAAVLADASSSHLLIGHVTWRACAPSQAPVGGVCSSTRHHGSTLRSPRDGQMSASAAHRRNLAKTPTFQHQHHHCHHRHNDSSKNHLRLQPRVILLSKQPDVISVICHPCSISRIYHRM